MKLKTATPKGALLTRTLLAMAVSATVFAAADASDQQAKQDASAPQKLEAPAEPELESTRRLRGSEREKARQRNRARAIAYYSQLRNFHGSLEQRISAAKFREDLADLPALKKPAKINLSYLNPHVAIDIATLHARATLSYKQTLKLLRDQRVGLPKRPVQRSKGRDK